MQQNSEKTIYTWQGSGFATKSEKLVEITIILWIRPNDCSEVG